MAVAAELQVCRAVCDRLISSLINRFVLAGFRRCTFIAEGYVVQFCAGVNYMVIHFKPVAYILTNAVR